MTRGTSDQGGRHAGAVGGFVKAKVDWELEKAVVGRVGAVKVGNDVDEGWSLDQVFHTVLQSSYITCSLVVIQAMRIITERWKFLMVWNLRWYSYEFACTILRRLSGNLP